MELHSRCETDDLGCQRKWRRWRGDSLSLLHWIFRHLGALGLFSLAPLSIALRCRHLEALTS
jgi:hypothetical protein